MAQFTVRVELHQTEWADYGQLHAAMEQKGFFRLITADGGSTYHLPWEIDGTASLTSMQVLEIARAAAGIKVFRDTHDVEATGKTQKPRDQFASSDIAVAAEAFITNNAQTSRKEIAEDLLEKDSGYTATG